MSIWVNVTLIGSDQHAFKLNRKT